MDLSPLETLPIELFVRVLDFLEPHECSGLSCTCQHAITLVNRKIDDFKDQDPQLWFEFDLDESRALNKQLPSWKSLTARYVARERKKEKKERREERRKRKEENSRQQWQSELRRWELENRTCENYGLPNDDDPDL